MVACRKRSFNEVEKQPAHWFVLGGRVIEAGGYGLLLGAINYLSIFNFIKSYIYEEAIDIAIENIIPSNAIILFFLLYLLVLSINFSSDSFRDIKEYLHMLSILFSIIELNNFENLNKVTNNTVIIR